MVHWGENSLGWARSWVLVPVCHLRSDFTQAATHGGWKALSRLILTGLFCSLCPKWPQAHISRNNVFKQKWFPVISVKSVMGIGADLEWNLPIHSPSHTHSGALANKCSLQASGCKGYCAFGKRFSGFWSWGLKRICPGLIPLLHPFVSANYFPFEHGQSPIWPLTSEVL